MTCTRCGGTGFLNLEQMEDVIPESGDLVEFVLEWIANHTDHDVQVCDCCGDGTGWYGEPGEHYNSEDPVGKYGPYAYNGGLCECN